MYYLIDTQGNIVGWSADALSAPGIQSIAIDDYNNDPAIQIVIRKRQLLRQASDAAQAFIAKVAGIDTVPLFERESWVMQGIEAQAWAANPQAPTPILAGIAAARGVPLDLLRQKALVKAQAYAALTASVAGQRQAYEDAIRAADSLDALDAISILYRPPRSEGEA